MSFNVKLFYSPIGNAWNLFSAGAFEGSADPGSPGADDADSDLPPIESSDISENLDEMSSDDGPGQVIGNASEEDGSSSFSGGNDRRTK